MNKNKISLENQIYSSAFFSSTIINFLAFVTSISLKYKQNKNRTFSNPASCFTLLKRIITAFSLKKKKNKKLSSVSNKINYLT
jgi:hypothetical protein